MPQEAWRTIWRTILGPLAARGRDCRRSTGRRPSARATAATNRCRPTSRIQALHRSADWIVASRILRHPKWPKEVLDRSLHYNTVRDMPAADWPLGDGSFGILEGFSSTIRADGSQPMRYAVRNDNMCEVAMLMALDAAIRQRPQTPSDRRQPARLHLPEVRPGLGQPHRSRQARVRAGRLVAGFAELHTLDDDNGRALLEHVGRRPPC